MPRTTRVLSSSLSTRWDTVWASGRRRGFMGQRYGLAIATSVFHGVSIPADRRHTDLPYRTESSRAQLCCLRRGDRLHNCGTGVAGWHCEHRIPDILLLHGHQPGLCARASCHMSAASFSVHANLLADHLPSISRDKGEVFRGYGRPVW